MLKRKHAVSILLAITFTKLNQIIKGWINYFRIGSMKMFIDNYPKDYPEPESVVAVLRQGEKVEELPVVMRARSGGVSSISLKKSVYYMIKVSLAIIIERIRK